MRILQPISFPLQGASLIEASAGTGKTYTIVNLYLRLLLGHGCAPHDVEQILVVTFTKAATAELKSRIRQKLSACYYDFVQGHSDDVLVNEIIQGSQDRNKDCQRLGLAVRKMDEAAIFTIHSFCQRVLLEHAFESGAMYEQSLIMDESQWLKLAVEDYWRKHIVPLPASVLELLSGLWTGPEALQFFIRPLLYRNVQVDDPVSFDHSISQIVQYSEQVRAIKSQWLGDGLASRFQQVGFKKNTKLGKDATYIAMSEYCQGKSINPPMDKNGWDLFSSDKIVKALPKGKHIDELGDIPISQFDSLNQAYLRCIESLKTALASHALRHIKHFLNQHKSRMGLLSPDDLLLRLEQALSQENGEQLCNVLRNQYPAALIDEFQDTDPQQFALFSQVYIQRASEQNCLIMIGDPKQAIYAFRGADIFTYIEAKQLLPEERHFTLNTNWRSQPQLVAAINSVFSASENGFMFEQDIPFVEVLAAKAESVLDLDGNGVKSLAFHCLWEENQGPVSWARASQTLAENCAAQIGDFIQRGELPTRKVSAGDCCVLVRDRDEAALIKNALNKRNIASVFLIRKSVFATQTAQDLYLLLTAVANPASDKRLKAALCTDLIAMTANQLEQLINDEVRWQELVDQCYMWQQAWQQQGVMLALLRICEHFEVFPRLVSSFADGMRRVTDLRHLFELLQQQSMLTPAETQLLHWFAEHLHDPDHDHEGQQLRLETDANLVQIITMHASKGLEFPLVFMPFACRFRSSKAALYHDQNKALRIDFNSQPERLALTEFERVAEDTRLLYVAFTRAVYHCSVGIWDPAHSFKKGQSILAQSALGQLLCPKDEQVSLSAMLSQIAQLAAQCDIGCYPITDVAVNSLPAPANRSMHSLQCAAVKRPVKRDWQLTSYSAISRHKRVHHDELPGRDEGLEPAGRELGNAEEDPLDKFHFTKGAQAGSFLHGVLEHIDFTAPTDLAKVVEQQGQWYGIEEKWYPMVECWINEALTTPFSEQLPELCLSRLGQRQRLVEMEFRLPLKQVRAKDFNQLINSYAKGATRQYDFDLLNGMLKGYIDLTFEYQGKYYVADYKSNFLGGTAQDYRPQMLSMAMDEHDYQLQAILYVVALHRWLGSNLPDYQYDTHIGGAFYLFLRGMEPNKTGSGIYHVLPKQELILALDALFRGQCLPQEQNTTLPDDQGGQMELW